MFENLSEKFQGVLKKLRGHGRISEGNVEGALNEVRLALLEADVNYKVVKDFVAAVKEKALGAEVLASLSPDQHFIKIVHEEMTRMMGAQAQELNLARKPPVPVMLVGLQGSGKTTTCGKLALYLQKRKRTPVPGPRRRLPPGRHRAAEGPRAAAGDPGVRLPPRRRPGGDLPGGVEVRRAERLRHGPPRHRGAPSHRRAADGGALPDQGGGRPGGHPPGGRRDDRPGRRERGEGVPREAGAHRRGADEDGRRRPRRGGPLDPRGDRGPGEVRRDGGEARRPRAVPPRADGLPHPRDGRHPHLRREGAGPGRREAGEGARAEAPEERVHARGFPRPAPAAARRWGRWRRSSG